MAVQQKTAKKNLYFDSRDLKEENSQGKLILIFRWEKNSICSIAGNEETNENWDEKQLEEIAEKKHGEKDRKQPNQTNIVRYKIEILSVNNLSKF